MLLIASVVVIGFFFFVRLKYWRGKGKLVFFLSVRGRRWSLFFPKGFCFGVCEDVDS